MRAFQRRGGVWGGVIASAIACALAIGCVGKHSSSGISGQLDACTRLSGTTWTQKITTPVGFFLDRNGISRATGAVCQLAQAHVDWTSIDAAKPPPPPPPPKKKGCGCWH